MITREKKQAPPSVVSTAAQEFAAAIVKDHGKEAAQVMGSVVPVTLRGVISTRCPPLDYATGVWGIPYGRLSMIYGPESGGKTTIALQIAAETQAKGGVVIYMDMEYKLDLEYAAKLGVDVPSLIVSQPPHLEKCMSVIETAVLKMKDVPKEGPPLLIVFDSLNAAATKAELEGGFEDRHVASAAAVMSTSIKRIIQPMGNTNASLLFISQVREKIGVMWGDKEDTACGKAPKFYSSLIIQLSPRKHIKKGDITVGNVVSAYIAKNQVAPPFARVEFDIIYGQGTDNAKAIMDIGVSTKVISQNGAWYQFEDIKWCGAPGYVEKIAADPTLERRIWDAILKTRRGA